jgi:hypothetical protein
MHRLIISIAAICATCAICAAASTEAGDIALQPFIIDHQNRVDSPADVSFLLDAPAGRDGFITIKNGHLTKPDGTRLRIWGVNLTGWVQGSTMLPPREEATRWAKTLARSGVNCVRFHFLDRPTRDAGQEAETDARREKAEASGQRFSAPPAGLIDGLRNDTLMLDAGALDRLDYFIAELKKAGIYANLNLNVGRHYKEGDGVPDHGLIGVAKGVTYIGERLVELQRDYARKLLTHYNPYTKSTYCDEPAIATVEIVNENSLFEFWFRNWLRGELVPGGPRYQLDFPPYYEKQLGAMYQTWLKENRTQEELGRLRELARVPPGAPLPRTRRGDFSTRPAELFRAEADFYTHVEKNFLTGMYSFLKKDLGVKAPVIGNADHTYWIPNMPMMRANSLLDFIDGHVYWQHPAIWGARNTPMVDQPTRSTIVKLSRSPFLDRPFTVSEVNHPNPSEYCAEMIPILAAYAAFQDWDGIYFYTFEPKIGKQWRPHVADEFDIALDPVKMVQMSAGALIFSRADVSPAKQTVARSYSAGQVTESIRLPAAERPYFTPGFPLSLPLRHGSRIRALDAKPTQPFEPDPAPPYVSDTGELAWNLPGGKHGFVTIDTSRSQGVVGYVAEHRPKTRHLAPEIKNTFCAITLSSLTPEAIRRSPALLLTACSRWQNTGSKWNARRTLWEDWGKGPTLIEPVTGWLVLQDIDGAVDVSVTPLDGAWRPLGEPTKARMVEDGWEIPLGAPATTHYLIMVAR